MFGMGKDKPAELHYYPADYEIRRKGSFVLCAVTGEKITLDNLNYWNVERQEAYINGAASLKRELEVNS